MSHLLTHERGFILRDLPEELTRWRQAHVSFEVPEAGDASRDTSLLLLLAGPRAPTPLHLTWNGHALATLPADTPADWAWHRVDVPADALRAGPNELVLRADNAAMNGWAVPIEPGHTAPRSAVSFDGGQNWQHDGMSTAAVLRGEYVARLRIPGNAPAAPAIVYDDPNSAPVRGLKELIPAEVQNERDPWQQVLKLRTWLSRCWTHCPRGATYAPWEPNTIIDWAHRGDRALGMEVTAMCVHFGAAMTACATALGHRARCIVITREINSGDGHFVAEVFDEAQDKWVVHDANVDMHYEDDGRPLSAIELSALAQRGVDCTPLVSKGLAFDEAPPHLTELIEQHLLTGSSYRLAGVWTRNDYITDPRHAPPDHGRTRYTETDLLWYTPTAEIGEALAMFPWHSGDASDFA